MAAQVEVDTLKRYASGARTAPPDVRARLFDASVNLGAGVELWRSEANGIAVRVLDVPELNDWRDLARPETWTRYRGAHEFSHPHLALVDVEAEDGPRYDVPLPVAEVPTWGAFVNGGCHGSRVAVFPRGGFVRVIDFAEPNKTADHLLPGEFLVANVDGKVRLCQQLGFYPRSGERRQLRVLPAWPSWAPQLPDSDHPGEDFEPFVREVGTVNVIRSGNIQPAA